MGSGGQKTTHSGLSGSVPHIATSISMRRPIFVAGDMPRLKGTPAEFDQASTHEVESGIASLKSLANYVMPNEKTPARLKKGVSDLIAEYFKGLP